MDELKIEVVSVDELEPYLNNAKIHTAEQIEQIKKSIEEFGFNDPIGVWKNEVVEGHGRLIALKELGYDNVPIIRLDHMTDEQRKAYMLVHNQLTMNTGFDIDLLKIELEDITDIDMDDFGFDMDLLGYDDDWETNEVDEKTEIKKFSDEQIQKSVIENWRTYDSLDKYVECIIDEPTAMYQYNRLCQGYNDGYNISLLFNPHRLDTETKKSKSIFYGINNDDVYKKQFARYMVNVSAKCVVPYQYYKYIGIGSGGYQYVNEFPPYFARDIYKRFCKDGDKILNPCAGWGGRLLGLSSLMLNDIEYVEIEPSKKTYEGLCNIKKWLDLGDNYKQICDGFENVNLESDYFDFVFTSPPYFDTERYSDDEKQSYKNKSSYEEWKEQFYYVMIDKIVRVMKKGAKCVLNVGNVKYPLEEDLIKRLKDKHNIKAYKLNDYHIGGNGIGDRTGEGGEPFVVFEKK